MKAKTGWIASVGLAVVGLVAYAQGAQDNAVQQELKRLQGKWQMVSHVVDGKADPALKGAIRVVEGERFTILRGDKILRKAIMKLDPTKKPGWIDITFTDGPEKGKTRKGIYVLKGDTHRICYGDLDKERPTAFASKPGSGQRLVVFKRIE